ncbi:SRPBCC family protein [Parasphingorhabdus pacifica]
MRYADGPSVRCEEHIPAPPEKVWELVTDIELPARLSPELQRVEWLRDANEPAVGAEFIGHNEHPALGTWSTISRVVELDPHRVFAWAVLSADPAFGDDPGSEAKADTDAEIDPMATWRFELETVPGGTRLWHSAWLGPARSGLSLAIDRMPEKEGKIVATRIAEVRTGIETTLAGIRNAVQ